MNNTINIVHYVSGFAETAGGVESFLLNMLESFEGDSSYKVSLLTRYAYEESNFYFRFLKKGYKVHSLGIKHLSPTNICTFKKRLVKFFKDNNFDILHMHGTDEPCILKIARDAGVKKILIHAHTPRLELNGRKQWVNVIKRVSRKRNEHIADKLLACSNAVLQTAYFSSKRNNGSVIVNGINTADYLFDERIRKKLRKDYEVENKFVIGHIGRFVDVKNHSFILSVFNSMIEKNMDVVLILIGNGPDYEKIKNSSKQLGIDKNILFLGERNDVSCLLNMMDCIIFPSKFEGLSITLVEAQCNGIPCVVSDNVSRETDLTTLISRCSLSDDIDCWVQKVVNAHGKIKREEYASYIKEAGFDVADIKERLLPLYHFSGGGC